MENIEYIYDEETQKYINSLKAELNNLKMIYLPLLEETHMAVYMQKNIIQEYLEKGNILSNHIAQIMNENAPIALSIDKKIFKYKDFINN